MHHATATWTYTRKYIDRIAYKTYVRPAIPYCEKRLMCCFFEAVVPSQAAKRPKFEDQRPRASST